jgi:hypothetical protein
MPRVSPNRVLLFIPIFVFLLSILLVNAAGPFYLGGNFDPEYAELGNALSALTFRAPPHLDHPGVTLHFLGAFVILVKWITSCVIQGPWQPLETAAFRDPETYLHAIHLAIIILLAMSIYYAGREFHRVTGFLAGAICLQAGLFLFPWNIYALFRVSPEPLLIAAVFALTIPLTRLIFAVGDTAAEETAMSSIWAGVAFGAGVITKVSLAPLATVVLIARGRRNKLRFIAGMVGAAVFFLWPSVPRFRDRLSWFTSIVTHSGIYGSGPVGLPAGGVLGSNLHAILTGAPLLAILLVVFAVVAGAAFMGRFPGRAIQRNLALAMAAGCVGVFVNAVLTVKHFRGHYLIPSQVFMGFMTAVVMTHCAGAARPKFRVAAGAVLAAVGFVGLLGSQRFLSRWLVETAKYRADVATLLNVANSTPGCVQIGYYRSSLPLYAIQYGNIFSEWHHKEVLSRMYPDAILFDFWTKRFESFSGEDKAAALIEMLQNGRCVVAEGTRLAPGEMGLPGVLYWDEIVSLGNEAVYSLGLETPVSTNPASVRYLGDDARAQGNWQGAYGAGGFWLADGSRKSSPYARVKWSNRDTWRWEQNPTSSRALKAPEIGRRIAAAWYGPGQFAFEIDLRDNKSHRVAMYFVDWDSDSRSQEVRLTDVRTGNVLDRRNIDHFHEGRYLTWEVSGRVSVTIVQKSAAANVVVSGVFLD